MLNLVHSCAVLIAMCAAMVVVDGPFGITKAEWDKEAPTVEELQIWIRQIRAVNTAHDFWLVMFCSWFGTDVAKQAMEGCAASTITPFYHFKPNMNYIGSVPKSYI